MKRVCTYTKIRILLNSDFIQYVVNQGDIRKSHLKLYLPSLADLVISKYLNLLDQFKTIL